MGQPVRRAVIIGGGVGAAQCALVLAQLGVKTDLITPSMELSSAGDDSGCQAVTQDLRERPVLLRSANHPLVTVHTNCTVDGMAERRGEFTVRATKHPRYVRTDLCTSCGRCAEVCSAKVPVQMNDHKLTRSAIHAPFLGAYAVPSSYTIDKLGIAPCTAACPLGINVTGFVSLLSRGKVDAALALIQDAAPLAGVLGRVCTHPCEGSCKRAEVDAPVFIRALHRFAADHASGGIHYTRKAPAGSRKEKIAIVGSGPAGLTAAWELARRGYTPTIFESHAVVGGMLATGIPRFRLPREVREREVKAIEDLGVEIRTGVTVGRDVTITDLRERGYRAFFVAIGAQENRSLNIPGENLDGVVDSTSLLFELNLRVGATVGRNMVVIGGGNAAVDCARAARRRSRRNVTILYRRTIEEMPAVKEDVDEALHEGISIQYLTQPVEILGDGVRVTGVRCQRIELGEVEEDGRPRPVPIVGSEYVIPADHVVLAIGQRPSSAQLNLRNLDVDSRDATIKVDPITLETSLPGVFAGGDCVAGPNNVVEAMAAGLRAAESIDRRLRGRSLRRGERVERPQPAEVDVAGRYASPDKRAEMPFIPRARRFGTFEETALGLAPAVAQREAGRCLDCPLCSGCMECVEACELEAVFHADSAEQMELDADVIIDFTTGDTAAHGRTTGYPAQRRGGPTVRGAGVYAVRQTGGGFWSEMARASALALEVAAYLGLKNDSRQALPGVASTAPSEVPQPEAVPSQAANRRTGVVLCQCGGSISSVIDFTEVSTRALDLPGVLSVQQVPQVCTEKGALHIADHAAAWQLGRVIVAACRCCGEDQICFSCTDRRVKCRQYLEEVLPQATGLEFVNIRERCAWVHKDDPANATQKAVGLISSAVARGRATLSGITPPRRVDRSVLLLGTRLGGLAAADQLAAQGYPVSIVSGPEVGTAYPKQRGEYARRRGNLLKQLQERGVEVKPWPERLELGGSPGNYQLSLTYGAETVAISAGTLILDLGQRVESSPVWAAVPEDNLLGRMLAWKGCGSDSPDPDSTREVTLGETAGIFILCGGAEGSPEDEVARGRAVAASAWVYLAQGTTRPRSTAVSVNAKLCRGCGECAAVCPYIEMRPGVNGAPCAYVDSALCLGCGACVARCPTGAISQAVQSDTEIAATLEGMLGRTEVPCEVA